jgi:hypothetical protein
MTVVLLVVSVTYLHRYHVTRPAIGVCNRSDVLCAVAVILLAHVVYVLLPLWAAIGLFALAVTSAVAVTLEPLCPSRWLAWLISLACVVGDIGIAWHAGVVNPGFLLVNDGVMLAVIVGVANLWVQSGVQVRDAVLFSLLLAVFDLVATSVSSLTSMLFARFQSAPLMPAVAWVSHGTMLSGGVGDVLLVTVWVLVMEKAYGRAASISSGVISLGVIAVLLSIDQPWPAMIVLAPLMIGHSLFWRQRRPVERTMLQLNNADHDPLARSRKMAIL